MNNRHINNIWKEIEAKRQAELRRQIYERKLQEDLERSRREQLLKMKMNERNVSVAAAAAAAAGAGAGGSRKQTLISGEGLGILISSDSETGDFFYPQSADLDIDGNIIYLSSWPNDENRSVLRKINSLGEVIWERTVDADIINIDMSPFRVRRSNTGGAYVVHRRSVIKYDTNGDLVWNFTQDPGEFVNFNFTAQIEDNLGNLFVLGYGNIEGTNFTVVKFDETGNIIGQIVITLSDAEYTGADIVLDNNGDLVIPINSNLDGENWSATILKVRADLDTYESPTWFYTISDENSGENYENDQDSLAFGKDSSDNFYSFGYFNGVTKINSSAEFVWAIMFNENQTSMAVDTDGSCYVLEGVDREEEGNGESTIRITKISTDGNLLWSYVISSQTDELSVGGFASAGDGEINSSFFIRDGFLLVMARTGYAGQEFLLKLSLEPISGTYGEFTFTEDTAGVQIQTINAQNNTNISVDWYTNGFLVPYNIIFDEPTVIQTTELKIFG